MLITKQSPVTGELNSMDLPVTQEQLTDWKVNRKLVQDVFPHLTAVEREFLISGYTAEDWEFIFGSAP